MIKGKKNNVSKKAAGALFFIAAAINSACLCAYAETEDEIINSVTKPITTINNVLIGVMAVIGVTVVIKGLSDALPALQGHDTSAAIKGFITVVVGLLLIFFRQLLKLCGITI